MCPLAKSSFHDFANTWLNLDQSIALKDINKQFSNLNSLQAKKEVVANKISEIESTILQSQEEQRKQTLLIEKQLQISIDEALKKERLKAIINTVFAIRVTIDKVVKEQDNISRMVLLMSLSKRFEDEKFSIEGLERFEDKEYAQKVLDDFQDYIKKTNESLPDEELSEINDFMEAKPSLENSIKMANVAQFVITKSEEILLWFDLRVTQFKKRGIDKSWIFYGMLCLLFLPIGLPVIIVKLVKEAKKPKLMNDIITILGQIQSFIDEINIDYLKHKKNIETCQHRIDLFITKHPALSDMI